MRNIITTVMLVLLPFGAGAEVPPMAAVPLPAVGEYRLVREVSERENRMPDVHLNVLAPVPLHELSMPYVPE